MKKFEVPEFYRSPIISKLKNLRRDLDPKKKDYTPTILDFGPVQFLIARHFGFCYGVENAIETSYKALSDNPGKNVYLLSEMIHNPAVNQDLIDRGVKFIMDTKGTQLIPWDKIKNTDVVLIPAFGTTLEIEELLQQKGIETETYNTTCPFVERVWKMSEKLGKSDFTIVIHGKANHEETRATFSHSSSDGPAVIVKNMEETILLSKFITKELPEEDFYILFKNRYSEGFKPYTDLQKIGVVNQTTMLASETKEIAAYLKNIVEHVNGQGVSAFADTRDSLCYATNDNQNSTYGLLAEDADIAIVVGGYNSSNTSHLVELCEEKLPTYFINDDNNILDKSNIRHFDYSKKQELICDKFLPNKPVLKIILTSGASCPDSLVDKVLMKVLSYYDGVKNVDDVLKEVELKFANV